MPFWSLTRELYTNKICAPFCSLRKGATVADASTAGYRTILLDDCCRGVDANEIDKTKNNVKKNHGVVINSNQVLGNVLMVLL